MLDRKTREWKKTVRFGLASAAFGMVAGFGTLTFSQEVIKGQEAIAEETTVTVQNSQTAVADAMASIGMTDLNSMSSNIIDVSGIVERALPSVVAVNCITYTQQNNGMNMFGMGSR
ncbi:MAG: hypothetical protein J6J86_02960, partial [Lachnospiraceae bacterium]|nr:hypothetical protein [Lachnospiraceae bacterium]